MKVCFFCVTSTRSGIGDGFLSMVQALDGHPDLIVVKGGAYRVDEFGVCADNIHTVNFTKKNLGSYFSFSEWRNLKSFLKEKGVDRIFFYSTAPINILVNIIYRKAAISFWCHDPLPHPGEPIKSVLPKEIDLNFLLRSARCRKIFVASQYLKSILIDNRSVCDSQISVYPLPIIDEICRHGSLREWQARRYDFIFWGRIEEYKGLHFFASALTLLREQGAQFNALIAEADQLKNFCPLL